MDAIHGLKILPKEIIQKYAVKSHFADDLSAIYMKNKENWSLLDLRFGPILIRIKIIGRVILIYMRLRKKS